MHPKRVLVEGEQLAHVFSSMGTTLAVSFMLRFRPKAVVVVVVGVGVVLLVLASTSTSRCSFVVAGAGRVVGVGWPSPRSLQTPVS